MYAVIETGGKQYKVSEGSTIKVEKIDAEIGGVVEIDRVLAIGKEEGLSVGRPILGKSVVLAEVTGQAQHKKVVAYKFRRRKDSDRKVGHRQQYTELRIKEIKNL